MLFVTVTKQEETNTHSALENVICRTHIYTKLVGTVSLPLTLRVLGKSFKSKVAKVFVTNPFYAYFATDNNNAKPTGGVTKRNSCEKN